MPRPNGNANGPGGVGAGAGAARAKGAPGPNRGVVPVIPLPYIKSPFRGKQPSVSAPRPATNGSSLRIQQNAEFTEPATPETVATDISKDPKESKEGTRGGDTAVASAPAPAAAVETKSGKQLTTSFLFPFYRIPHYLNPHLPGLSILILITPFYLNSQSRCRGQTRRKLVRYPQAGHIISTGSRACRLPNRAGARFRFVSIYKPNSLLGPHRHSG